MILLPFICSLWYCAGELFNKNIKYFIGVPIAAISFYTHHSWVSLLCIITYLIGCSFGYGENNWLTKLLGNRGAITFCGFAMGIASFPVLGILALLQALLSATAWFYLSILDDDDKLKEPWIGLLRGLTGTIIFVFV